jgi:glycosyltransferase involved in cell wall biosynthesis
VKLLIISNMEHYIEGETVWGWGPTVREIDHLATIFEEVNHLACLHEGAPAASSLPYTQRNIHLIPVPPAGGNSLAHKFGILKLSPLYLRTIWKALPSVDVVHIRCPANIPLLAILLLSLLRQPTTRWIKYAGNWQGYNKEPLSYRFQRWWLRRNFARSMVTVNGEWPSQPSHVVSFFNPCLESQEVTEGATEASNRKAQGTLRLLFVGALNEAKGVLRAIEIMCKLREIGADVTLDFVGDGPDRQLYEKMADDLGLAGTVAFHGWVRRTELSPYYAAAHCILLPSKTEGWPKVLSEAMAYGVVPIAAAVSSIPQYLEQFKVGRSVVYDDIDGYVRAVSEYGANREIWRDESENALKSAHLFGYEEYVEAVSELLQVSAS